MSSQYSNRYDDRNYEGERHPRYTTHTGQRGQRGRGGRGRVRGGGGQTVPPRPFAQQTDNGQVRSQTNLEEESLRTALEKRATDDLLTPETMPCRPAFATGGDTVNVFANYTSVGLGQDIMLHRYMFEVTTQEDSSADGGATACTRNPKGRKLKYHVGALLSHLASEHLNTPLATDYSQILITTEDLFPEKDIIHTPHQITLAEKHEFGNDTTGWSVVYTFKEHRQLSLNDFVATCLNSSNSDFDESSPRGVFLQALNIIAGQHPKSQISVANIGANKHYKFDPPDDEKLLDGGLTAYKGAFVSMRPATNRLLANIQVKASAMYNGTELMVLIHDYMKATLPKTDVRAFWSLDWGEPKDLKLLGDIEKFIKKLAIRIDYPTRENAPKIKSRIATIRGFAHSSKAQKQEYGARGIGDGSFNVQFWYVPRDGEQGEARYITVMDYFNNIKKCEPLKSEGYAPVVDIGTDQKPQFIPADFCTVTSGQVYPGKLESTQTAIMVSKFAVQLPPVNANLIIDKLLPTLGWKSPPESPRSQVVERFGLETNNKLVTIQARQLPSPKVFYKQSSIKPDGGAWNMARTKFANVGHNHVSKWACLRIYNNQSSNAIQHGVDTFCQVLQEVGMASGTIIPTFLPSVTSPRRFNENMLESLLDEHYMNNEYDFLLVILPGKKTDPYIYNIVKRVCDHIMSTKGKYLKNICVLESNLAEAKKHNLANVALKLNLKRGGTNQYMQRSDLFSQQDLGSTMVIGLDITHPGPGSIAAAPSIMSVVANTEDQYFSQWPGGMHILPKRTEILKHDDDKAALQNLFKSRLILWHKTNQSYPENIILFRDGVSEGQYTQVISQELAVLKIACRQFKLNPRISVIIVGKRHNTRFYPTAVPGNSDSTRAPDWNCLPGTVVDRGVTEAWNWDFYLQAHSPLHGTAKPTYYYILYDEIFRNFGNNAADVVQSFIHNFSYLYGRATKAVSYCPPCYYAHLLCERGRRLLSSMYDGSSRQSAAEFQVPKPQVDDRAPFASQQRQRAALKTWRENQKIHNATAERTFIKNILAPQISIGNELKDTMFYI